MNHIMEVGALFMATLLAVRVFGQGISQQSGLGGINGVVRDASGALIPEARVTVINSATGVQRIGITSNLGFYTIPALPSGDYRVTANKPGFTEQVRQ